MQDESFVCLSCELHLPKCAYASYAANPMETVFKGRLAIQAGASLYFFDKRGVVQRMVHRLKYAADHALASWMGMRMAIEIKDSIRFKDVDLLMAVPLHPKKKFIRGYNQAEWLIEGMRLHWSLPIGKSLKRVKFTESQTRKGKMERWHNVKDAFSCFDQKEVKGKHVALVDDVITTGATLEACGKELLSSGAASISIICFASAQ